MNTDSATATHRVYQRSAPQPAGGWREMATGSDLGCPVRIRSLGRFGVQRDERSLTSSTKARHQRHLEILQALIALGGRGVHVELLSEALWPEADGDKAQSSFDVTLHRLRKMIELKDVILVNNRRVTLNNKLVWVDVWEFECSVNDAENLLERINEPGALWELARNQQRLLSLYQGAFLEGESAGPWSLPLRERLRSKLLRHMLEAGRVWESAGQWKQAIRCYRKGLEIDPLFESLYERLMLCLRQTGQISQALTTYQRCRAILLEQFEIEPCRATNQLYLSLTA